MCANAHQKGNVCKKIVSCIDMLTFVVDVIKCRNNWNCNKQGCIGTKFLFWPHSEERKVFKERLVSQGLQVSITTISFKTFWHLFIRVASNYEECFITPQIKWILLEHTGRLMFAYREQRDQNSFKHPRGIPRHSILQGLPIFYSEEKGTNYVNYYLV